MAIVGVHTVQDASNVFFLVAQMELCLIAYEDAFAR